MRRLGDSLIAQSGRGGKPSSQMVDHAPIIVDAVDHGLAVGSTIVLGTFELLDGPCARRGSLRIDLDGEGKKDPEKPAVPHLKHLSWWDRSVRDGSERHPDGQSQQDTSGKIASEQRRDDG